MIGTCKLCKNEAELKISHFIPSFIGKWVKKTSITGFLRHSQEIEKRVQDLAKEYWLCGNCEALFSTWEREFANKIFYPFVEEGNCKAIYESWLSKFCASLSWRTLTYMRHLNISEPRRTEYIENIKKAETHLSKYLLGQSDSLFEYQQHLIPLEQIESSTGPLPVNINRYFLRTIAMDIIGNSESIFIYTKIPSFIILGFVKVNTPNSMRSSKVALKTGEISPRDYTLPYQFKDYLYEKANKVNELQELIPTNQQEKIENFVIKNPDKAANSKTFEAFLADYKLHGEVALKK